MDEARLVKHDNRVQATLELKANTDVSTAAMRGANERSSKRASAKSRAEKAEFTEILKMGGNPYVEFKKRDMEKAGVKEEKRERGKVKKQQAALAAKMVKEDDYNRKLEEHEKMAKEYVPERRAPSAERRAPSAERRALSAAPSPWARRKSGWEESGNRGSGR